jgi:hypothetical protein
VLAHGQSYVRGGGSDRLKGILHKLGVHASIGGESGQNTPSRDVYPHWNVNLLKNYRTGGRKWSPPRKLGMAGGMRRVRIPLSSRGANA